MRTTIVVYVCNLEQYNSDNEDIRHNEAIRPLATTKNLTDKEIEEFFVEKT